LNELILILGAGIFQKSFILTAVNNNYNIILFDKYEPTWIKDFASISFFNIDISNTKECLKKAREYSLNAVVSPYNDAGILSCSLIANEQKLPGPGLFASELSRNKSKFRGFLKTNKFRTPLCYEVSSTENLKEVSKILVVPAVIKPNDGSGSRGVFYIGSIDELDFRYE